MVAGRRSSRRPARTPETKSDASMHVHHRWAQAMTLIQIAIALAAITILTRNTRAERTPPIGAAGGRDRPRRARRLASGDDLATRRVPSTCALPDADVDAVLCGARRCARRRSRRRRSCAASTRREPVEQPLAQRARARRAQRGSAPRSSNSFGSAGEVEQLRPEALPVHVFPLRGADHERAALADAAPEHPPRAPEAVVELGERGVAPATPASPPRPRQQRAALDPVRRAGNAERVEDRRHDVDALDDARVHSARASRRRADPDRRR